MALLGLNTDDHFAYIIGYPDGTVQPNGQITRAEATTIFFRLLTEESRSANLTKTNGYTDVASDAWYNTWLLYTSDAADEQWTALRETRDWKALEQ